ECGSQITANHPPPSADVAFLDFLASLARKECLQELQYGGVIEDLRTHVSATAPGRRDNQRNSIAQSDRPAANARRRSPAAILVQLQILESRIDAPGDFSRFRMPRAWSDKRRHVVEISIVLIVSENKNGLLPDPRILREDIHRLRDVPRSIPGGTG